MAIFDYLGRDSNGMMQKGQVDALSLDDAKKKISAKQINIISLAKAGGAGGFDLNLNISFGKKTISRQDLQLFCRQMQTLIAAGIPILQGIQQLSEATVNPGFKDALNDIGLKLKSGDTLSDAMARYPNYFSRLFINVVKVGERSGNLDSAFSELHKYIELENSSMKRVSSAIRYPIIVIISIILAILLLSTVVVPQFAKMFASFKTELPLPTIILLKTSYVIINYWYMFILAVVGFIIMMKLVLANPTGHYNFDKFVTKIPIIGKIIYKVLLARFCRLMSLLSGSAIPILDAINLTARSVNNFFVERHLLIIKDKVEQGSTLSAAMKSEKIFPILMMQMIEIGEETGNLEHMLGEVANFYEKEADFELDKLGEAIEPILLIVVGILVLMLALGVFLPMWDMVSFAKARA